MRQLFYWLVLACSLYAGVRAGMMLNDPCWRPSKDPLARILRSAPDVWAPVVADQREWRNPFTALPQVPSLYPRPVFHSKEVPCSIL